MLTLRDILLGVALPFLVSSLLIYAIAWILRRRIAGGAPAVAIGFALGCILVFGWTGFRPLNDFDWLIPFALLTAIVGILAEFLHWRFPGVYGALIPLLTWLSIHTQLSPFPLVTIMAAGWIWWIAWDHLLQRSPAPWTGLTMTVLAGFTSLILMLSDSQRIGQIGLALVGSVAAIWLVGWWTKNHLLWRGAGFAWGVVLFGLLLDGKFWAGLTWTNASLLLASPLLPWLAELSPFRRLTGWKLSVLRIVFVVVPVAIAVTLAIVAFQRAQQSIGADYY